MLIREILYSIKKAINNSVQEYRNPKLSTQDYLRIKEITKFEDAQRKKIYETVHLTNEQKAEIDEVFLDNYGYPILDTWHRHYTAFTGEFDKYYFPELLYIPEFEFYMNQNKAYNIVLEDKNFLPVIAKGLGVRTPTNLVSCSQGNMIDSKGYTITYHEVINMLSNAGKVFLKPSVGTSSGDGCRIANFEHGVDLISSQSIENVIRSLKVNYCVQEVVECHKSLRRIYGDCVNTFRVITYRWNNKIYSMPVILRIGQGGAIVDNAHAGGMFIAINDDGTLHKKAFTEFKKEYEIHPDTQLRFEGYKIDGFYKVVEVAKRMHSNLQKIGVVNWDLTIDENNDPVLIEANVYGGGIWVIQMAHGCGPFGEKTEEVLRWLKLMNSLPANKYCDHEFGKM